MEFFCSVLMECESSVDLILDSLKDFKSIILIGHSMGGVLSRYYIKRKEKLHQQSNVSIMITLATPHYGFQKLSYYFEPFLKHIFVPEAVEVLSQDKGFFAVINKYCFL